MNMPVFQDLLYASSEGISTLTLNRPARRNALTPNLVNELIVALETAGADPEVGALVLCGAGGSFCAGADLAAFQGGGELNTAIPQRGGFVELNLAFRKLGKPVIAKVERYALAGGLGLMCACQFAIAEDTASFATPEIDRGLFPMMIMANIFRLLPQRKGLELILLGERFGADEAQAMGLINQAVPSHELDATVNELATKLAAKPPNTMALGLRAFYAQSDKDFEEALRYLEAQLAICLQTPDALEGLSAFLEKRPPQWPPRQG
jgi:enoyl-CoA hydratase/carnithine racemase